MHSDDGCYINSECYEKRGVILKQQQCNRHLAGLNSDTCLGVRRIKVL